MCLKATVEIAVNYSQFRLRDFHKIGTLHYRTCLYYVDRQTHTKVFASVRNFSFEKLYFSQTIKKNGLIVVPTLEEPFIVPDGVQFVSRQFPVSYVNRNFAENTTCYWSVCVDVDRIEQLDLFIEVQLVFKPKLQISSTQGLLSPRKYFSANQPETIAVFKGKINKAYDIFTYLPVSFDEFESIQLATSYHAIVSGFTFHRDQELPAQLNQGLSFFSLSKKPKQPCHTSFKNYLNHLTDNFLSSKLKTFYFFYRDFLVSMYQNLFKRKLHYENIIKNDSSQFQRNKSAAKVLQFIGNTQKFQKLYAKMYRNTHENSQEFQVSKALISDIILDEFSFNTDKILSQWTRFNSFLKDHSYQIIQQEQTHYLDLIEQRYKNNIFSHEVKIQNDSDFTFSRYDDSGESHSVQAKQQNSKRLSEIDVWSGQFCIQNMSLIEKEQKNIKMFEQRYQLLEKHFTFKKPKTENFLRSNNQRPDLKENRSKKSDKKLHIIFLVHGFGATKTHMLPLKSFIESKYIVKVIISVQNIGRTQEPIESSGERLAEEVKKHLIEVKEEFKLSFVGHSMGGLIIRSAIPRLQKYRVNFESYISICSPHLGYLYEPPSLIKMGLWVLSQIQKCESVSEVEMKDNSDLRRCYLYELATNGSLNWFKKVAFVASSQDSYVPYESARVQKSARLLQEMQRQDKERGQIISQMVDGMVKDLREAKEISRMNVVFNIEERSLQALIGRLGHVKFLSDEQFIKEFVICFRRFFQ